ncbi:MAG TPA: thioredoxin domain-containing protein [Marinobacter sp.]|nr:thioredoxin domain-containing protein [Marinobacter sp.]
MGEAKRRKSVGKPPSGKSKSNKPLFVGITILIVGAILLGVSFLTAKPEVASGELPVAATDAAPFPAELDQFGISVGAADAPVVVREFADYQCPACARFAEASKRLINEYVAAGKVRFVYFELPLQQHKNAVPAALASRCAADQNAYWPMHEKLYSAQSQWSDSDNPVAIFTGYATGLGLEERRFRRCMTTELHKEAIEQSRQVAIQLRVVSTPTVLVDNIRLTRPAWGQLSAVVERELADRAD